MVAFGHEPTPFSPPGCGTGSDRRRVTMVTPCLRRRAVPCCLRENLNRAEGVQRAVALLNLPSFGGKDGFIKPNFNSADITPGSTHNDTLNALAGELRRLGAGPLTIGDRSGMGNTREVMQSKDALALARDLKARTVVLDELPDTEWDKITVPGMHWSKGFAFPRPVRRAGFVVNTCCLKTHRYGGHFTLSLKNSVGFAAKQVPKDSYNYMTELHSSRDQRRMIAEINAAYTPALVVLDAVQGFTTEGPDKGTLVETRDRHRGHRPHRGGCRRRRAASALRDDAEVSRGRFSSRSRSHVPSSSGSA